MRVGRQTSRKFVPYPAKIISSQSGAISSILLTRSPELTLIVLWEIRRTLWKMKILVDAYQQHRLNSTGANPNLTENTAEMDDLRRKVDTLAIACQALWEVLQQHTGMDESVILEKMTEIDARDGRLDGKAAPVVLECPACGRRSNAGRTVCLYCGASLSQAAAVEATTAESTL